MVYRALIVDDEPIIRHGLSSCVDWQAARIELAGEAANGETALEMIRDCGIDILITDIKMPKMDGLELIGRAKAFRPHLKAIVISSFNDFELVRQAVRLGAVVDYLLKPTMEPEDLVRLLGECRRRLDEERSLEASSSLYAAEREKNRRRAGGEEMRRALSGQPADVAGAAAGMEAPFVLAVWRLDAPRSHGSAAEAGIGRMSRTEAAAARLEQEFPAGLVCVTGEDELALLLSDRPGALMQNIRKCHERLDAEGCFFTVGVSPSFHASTSLAEAYGWTETAFVQAFYEGSGRCYTGAYGPAPSGRERAGGDIPGGAGFTGSRFGGFPETAAGPGQFAGFGAGLQDARLGGGSGQGSPRESALSDEPSGGGWIALRDAFSRHLADSDREGARQELDRIYDLWRSRAHAPGEVRRMAGDLLIMLASCHFYLKTEEKLELLLRENRKVRSMGGLRELTELVDDHFRKSWEIGFPSSAGDEPGGNHAVLVALVYIQERYRGNLSLQEVADHVHMSKNYFSEQFKRRTGLNFIDYTIRLRIQYACHLLETTTLKIHDIGTHCGFNSPKHFLKLFKRETGRTPIEYRNRTQSGGDPS